MTTIACTRSAMAADKQLTTDKVAYKVTKLRVLEDGSLLGIACGDTALEAQFMALASNGVLDQVRQ